MRSIPACAGEPERYEKSVGTSVYPRVCGGTRAVRKKCWYERLSPRVRGNQSGTKKVLVRASIPACAGEPAARRGAGRPGLVYPRVCGGTWWAGTFRWWAGGLSPRVRGNPNCIIRAWTWAGSIPACAGEPRGAAGALTDISVYPRVCGGTDSHPGRRALSWGLSPRVRGNPASTPDSDMQARSIPAYAGEP